MISKYILEQPVEASTAVQTLQGMRQWQMEYNGEPSEFAYEDGPISIELGPLQSGQGPLPAFSSLHPISEVTETMTDSDPKQDQLMKNFTIMLNNCEILESGGSKSIKTD
jgi:hypothetical protein